MGRCCSTITLREAIKPRKMWKIIPPPKLLALGEFLEPCFWLKREFRGSRAAQGACPLSSEPCHCVCFDDLYIFTVSQKSVFSVAIYQSPLKISFFCTKVGWADVTSKRINFTMWICTSPHISCLRLRIGWNGIVSVRYNLASVIFSSQRSCFSLSTLIMSAERLLPSVLTCSR